MTNAKREEQIDEAFDTLNHLIDARADLLYALQRAKEWDVLAAMAEDALADLDMNERLQALIDAAEELTDKLMEENKDG
jgi:hypothetical protein